MRFDNIDSEKAPEYFCMPKTYSTYDEYHRSCMKIIRKELENIDRLQPIGKYGMFKYNNMDHSILTGLYAAKNIMGEDYDIWEVNTEEEYHEEAR